MAYKQTAGRSPMAKTGRGLDSALLQVDPDPKKPKKKITKSEAQVKGFDEQFEIVKAKFPKSTVEKRANNLGSYTVRKKGGSFMYTPGKPVI
jgi:hypothetical protein